MKLLTLCAAAALALLFSFVTSRGAEPRTLIGAARVDITPELPIRLSGYQARATEAETAATPLFARALAFGKEGVPPVVLLSVEVIGVPAELSDAVAAALRENAGIPRANVAVCTLHVHSGPSIAGVLPYMFSEDLPAEQQRRIAAYTKTLQQRLIDVALAAINELKPGSLAWAEGRVDFAVQRRKLVDGKWTGFGVVPEGTVDHALPVMRVTDAQGHIRAVLANYACHCTTLGGGDNVVHADWAGDAARRIESLHSGAVALVTIGCGADANPISRGIPEVAKHGAALATEVERLLGGRMQPLPAVTATQYREISLELDRGVTREELLARQAPGRKPSERYAAMKFLEAMEGGGGLPTQVALPVQTWRFGDALAIVFLGGEVVADYALRLKREAATPLWMTAYANSVPCYIPSAKMYPEGGYEVDGSMDYYGLPTRLAAGTEDRLVAAVHAQLQETRSVRPRETAR